MKSIFKKRALKKGCSLFIAIFLASMMAISPAIEPVLAADPPPGTFPTSYYQVAIPAGSPSNLDQLEYTIAHDPNVITKWAQLADSMGFAWCGGEFLDEDGRTSFQNPNIVASRFDVTRGDGQYTLAVKNMYEGVGNNWDKRLNITLSNFRVVMQPSETDFGSPTVTMGDPIVSSSQKVVNSSSFDDTFSKEYSRTTEGTVTHETSLQLTGGVTITQNIDYSVFGMGGSTSLELNFSASQSWTDSFSQTVSDTVTDTYSGTIPAHTQRMIEQTTIDAKSTVPYHTKAWIVYDVQFDGILRTLDGYADNAACNAPTDHPQVSWKFGSNGNVGGVPTATMGAADYLEYLWSHRFDGITNNTSTTEPIGINWVWVHDRGATLNHSGVFNSDETLKVYTNQEVADVTGSFTCTGFSTQMRAQDPIPLYPLAKITAAGSIPTLNRGGTYDLSQVSLEGYDAYNVPFYGFKGLPVTWAATSGNQNVLSIDNSTHILKAEGGGEDSIIATVTAPYGLEDPQATTTITSSPLEVKVAKLANISITGPLPIVKPGDSFNLSNELTVTGTDQYGNSYDISGQEVTWQIASPGNYGSIAQDPISGDYLLTGNYFGSGTLTATVAGITSTPFAFKIGNPPALTSLTLSGPLPTMYVGSSYDLSSLLSLTGQDQYGFNYNINGQPVTWSLVSGNSFAAISGCTLTVTGKGNIAVIATVKDASGNNINSNWVSGTTDNSLSPPILTSLTLSGDLPPLYVGSNYDLSSLLEVAGLDQYGQNYDISGQTVSWSIISGNSFATISGNTLVATGEGDVALIACIMDASGSNVNSNWISGTIKVQPLLTTIEVTGSIPDLYPGDSFDLSELTLTGQDQFGKSFNITSLPTTWKVVSGGSFAGINGNTLTAAAIGSGTITATVGGVTSNTVNFNVLTVPTLQSLKLTGTINNLYVGNTCNLAQQLTLAGTDQDGNGYSIDGQPVTWTIVSGSIFASINGDTLTAEAAGPVSIQATVNGITSNVLSFTIYNLPVLSTVTASGTLPAFYIGDSCDLSHLIALQGIDQYGNSFDITGQPITWKLASGGSFATIEGSIFTANAVGSGSITATVAGVTSSKVNFNITSVTTLQSVKLTGSMSSLYVGKTYNLAELLTLAGADQYGNAYSLAGQPVTWKITSGTRFASIAGDTLTAKSVGSGYITATVNGITSNKVSFNIKILPVLRSIKLTGSITNLNVGDTCNLTQKLTLTGIDRNGRSYSLAGEPATWSIVSGNSFASINGDTITAKAAGRVTIKATVNGISSNLFSFTVHGVDQTGDIFSFNS